MNSLPKPVLVSIDVEITDGRERLGKSGLSYTCLPPIGEEIDISGCKLGIAGVVMRKYPNPNTTSTLVCKLQNPDDYERLVSTCGYKKIPGSQPKKRIGDPRHPQLQA